MGLLFFFNDTTTPGISTLALPPALPIFPDPVRVSPRLYRPRPSPAAPALGSFRPAAPHQHRLLRGGRRQVPAAARADGDCGADRKSTCLNSSHATLSYAVFCL